MTITETPDLRDVAIERLKKKQDFKAHVLVFFLTNTLLWMIWLATGAGFPWPIFPMFGWGIGVVMNAWDVYWRQPITEHAIEREMDHLTGAST